MFEPFSQMLFGAMEEQRLGDPWDLSTDIGPVISTQARDEIQSMSMPPGATGGFCDNFRRRNRVISSDPRLSALRASPALEKEVFGPILHIATFDADHIGQIVKDINASGYGLTFGMHSRIDDRVEMVTSG